MLVSAIKIIRELKKRKILPEYVSDFSRLPKIPRNKIILVYVEKKYLLPYATQIKISSIKQEIYMNFSKMVEKAREGKHLRRATWPEEMRIWSNGKILIHNTPYFGESFNQGIQGYIYVTEQVDVVADDWEEAVC